MWRSYEKNDVKKKSKKKKVLEVQLQLASSISLQFVPLAG